MKKSACNDKFFLHGLFLVARYICVRASTRPETTARPDKKEKKMATTTITLSHWTKQPAEVWRPLTRTSAKIQYKKIDPSGTDLSRAGNGVKHYALSDGYYLMIGQLPPPDLGFDRHAPKRWIKVEAGAWCFVEKTEAVATLSLIVEHDEGTAPEPRDENEAQHREDGDPWIDQHGHRHN